MNGDDYDLKGDDYEWYEPEDPTPRCQCPCCDYISLPERGEWLICPVCYWEDDGTDIDDLDRRSPCNHEMTLREARANFRAFGACERSMLKHVCPPEELGSFEYRLRKVE